MQRNKRKHGETSLPIQKAVEWVRDTASDLWQIIHTSDKSQGDQTHWRLPTLGWIKCNVDGAFYSRENAGATGAFLHAKAEWKKPCLGCYDNGGSSTERGTDPCKADGRPEDLFRN